MHTKSHALLICTLLIAAPSAFAQPAASSARFSTDSQGFGMERRGEGPGMMRHEEGGMGIVPPGMWWKNPGIITSLALTPDQQKRMDDIFRENRIQLIHMHASLEEEQVNLEPLLNSNPPDQAKTLAEVSRIADLRANLEKANAKMLLGLRGVLTSDQWTKLHTMQHRRGEGLRNEDMRNEGQHATHQHGPAGDSGQAGPGNGAPPPRSDQD